MEEPGYQNDGPFFDTEFAYTKYGLARISQFVGILIDLNEKISYYLYDIMHCRQ